LIAVDREHEVEFVFLRPRDIAVYVGNGILDLGITGRDLAVDSGADVTELLSLRFGRAAFYYAAPRGSGVTRYTLQGLRIATSYPHLVERDLAARQIDAQVIRLDGAVEISIRLGVADAIADVVQSGKTLEQAGLETIGEPILESEAVLIGRSGKAAEEPAAGILMERLRGIVVAREYAMIEYDLPEELLEQATALTPGVEAPTVSPLSKKGWIAVKAMTARKGINRTMDELKKLGARGIIVTDIRFCRL
jgi:ATP phosphoribosyltransferase